MPEIRISRIATNAIVFCLALFLGYVVVGQVVPTLRAPIVDEKLAALSGASPPYDTVFVGSSRVYHQFVPAVFDRGMATHGVSARSFNLGVDGATALESDWLIARVLAADTGALRRIILFPEVIRPALETENSHVDRVVLWHDSRRSALSLRSVTAADDPVGARLRWAYNHLDAFLLNLTRLGWAVSDREEKSVPLDTILGPRRDGFVALDYLLEVDPSPSLQRRRDELLNGRALFDAEVLQLAEDVKAHPEPPAAHELDYLDHLVARAAAADVDLIFVIPPGSSDRDWLRWAGREGLITLIDLNNPLEYPDLFRFDLWFDRGHLTEAGAIRFTQSLVDVLGPSIAGGDS